LPDFRFEAPAAGFAAAGDFVLAFALAARGAFNRASRSATALLCASSRAA